MANITTIGVGYVGLVTGACLADLGNNVACLNRNKKKSENLIVDLKIRETVL